MNDTYIGHDYQDLKAAFILIVGSIGTASVIRLVDKIARNMNGDDCYVNDL